MSSQGPVLGLPLDEGSKRILMDDNGNFLNKVTFDEYIRGKTEIVKKSNKIDLIEDSNPFGSPQIPSGAFNEIQEEIVEENSSPSMGSGLTREQPEFVIPINIRRKKLKVDEAKESEDENSGESNENEKVGGGGGLRRTLLSHAKKLEQKTEIERRRANPSDRSPTPTKQVRVLKEQ